MQFFCREGQEGPGCRESHVKRRRLRATATAGLVTRPSLKMADNNPGGVRAKVQTLPYKLFEAFD